jgi:hypothetical protein
MHAQQQLPGWFLRLHGWEPKGHFASGAFNEDFTALAWATPWSTLAWPIASITVQVDGVSDAEKFDRAWKSG